MMAETKGPPRWTQTTHQERISCDDLSLCGGEIDLTVKRVSEVHCPGDKYEWQLSIEFDEIRKPFRPCVTMAKKLAMALSSDLTKWTGEGMRMILDPTVRHGKENVGGVRITHLSSLTKPYIGMFCSSGGKRSSFRFDPLPRKSPENKLHVVSALFAEAENEEQFNRAKEAGAGLDREQKLKLTELHNAAEKRVMQEGRPCVKSGLLVTAKWCESGCGEASCQQKTKTSPQV